MNLGSSELTFISKFRSCLYGPILALALVLVASLTRHWPLGSLGFSIPYTTYYAAVVFAGLLGGFYVGIFAMTCSALVVATWSPLGPPLVELPEGLLGMFIFCLNCVLISLVSEQTHRALIQTSKDKVEAERANEQKTAFLSNMSHEMRTPLNVIIGLNHLLSQTATTRQQQDFLERMDGSAAALLGLIDDLLDMSKIEAGELSVNETPFSFESFLDDISSVANQQTLGKDLDFIVLYGPDIPQTLIGDRGRLRQILVNLVSNAIKFTSAGSVDLQVSCNWTGHNTVMATFVVQDDGPGIPDEKLDAVFEPFVQIELGRDRNAGGAGLGLAICKELAELLGATISAENRAARGARFILTVPFAVENPEDRLLSDLSGHQNTRNAVLGQAGSEARALCSILKHAQIPFEQTQDFNHFTKMILDPNERWDTVFVAQQLDEKQLNAIRDAAASNPQVSNLILVSRSETTEVELLQDAEKLNFSSLSLPILPTSLASAMKGEATESCDSGRTSATKPFSKVTALVVEDNEDNLVVIKGMLESFGIDVTCFRDGASAIDFLESAEQSPDIVLMDIQMPGMSGIEATRKIRESPRIGAPRIIAMTASALKNDVEACFAAGMDDHVSKPIKAAFLQEVIRKHLPHHPKTGPDETETGVGPKTHQHTEQVSFDFQGASILLIEDNQQLAKIVQVYFEKWGASVHVAYDLAMLDLIAKSPARKFDLVISDIHLGEGQDVGATLTSMRQDCLQATPIILTSGSPGVEKGRFPEPYSFINKPYQLADLASKAAQLIKSGQSV